MAEDKIPDGSSLGALFGYDSWCKRKTFSFIPNPDIKKPEWSAEVFLALLTDLDYPPEQTEPLLKGLIEIIKSPPNCPVLVTPPRKKRYSRN